MSLSEYDDHNNNNNITPPLRQNGGGQVFGGQRGFSPAPLATSVRTNTKI